MGVKKKSQTRGGYQVGVPLGCTGATGKPQGNREDHFLETGAGIQPSSQVPPGLESLPKSLGLAKIGLVSPKGCKDLGFRVTQGVKTKQRFKDL